MRPQFERRNADTARGDIGGHAGVALGLDRWLMLFLASDNIRDVIAFPKNQKASDMLTGAPAAVDLRQLRDLHIKVDVSK